MAKAPSWLVSTAKLTVILFILPASLTYLHLYHILARNELCLVGPAPTMPFSDGSTTTTSMKTTTIIQNSDVSKLFGIYAPSSRDSVHVHDGRNRVKTFRQVQHSSSDEIMSSFQTFLYRNWPSIGRISSLLASVSSLSSLLFATSRRNRFRSSTIHDSTAYRIIYMAESKIWMAHSQSEDLEIRSDPSPVTSSSAPLYPPSGVWWSKDRSDALLHVWCPGPATIATSNGSKGFFRMTSLSWPWWSNAPLDVRRNPNKQRHRDQDTNQNLEQALRIPATSLLLALNCALALWYYVTKTNPNEVAKIYSKIVYEGEWWRGFTGATAHFEPLHLGFNMMALYSLGTELEESYGSITFLFYNISMIPITTMIMMAMVTFQIKRRSSTGNPLLLAETSSVGYSGVLFAWMVIASLQRRSTCPIPFVPNMCFDTHEIWKGIKVNLSPIVQLFVAQLIMKRVSFIGHLAGIVVGFLLHWQLLPLEIMQPALLIPALLFGHLTCVRKLVPFPRAVTRASSAEEEQPDEEASSSLVRAYAGRRMRNTRERDVQRLLQYTRYAMGMVAVMSLAVCDFLGSLVWGYLVCFVFFFWMVESNAKRIGTSFGERNQEQQRTGVLLRGFCLSVILVLATDAMTIPGWILTRNLVSASRPLTNNLLLVIAFMLARICVSFAGLGLAGKLLSDIGETGEGIFKKVFGLVLREAQEVGKALMHVMTDKVGSFAGEGIRLGGRHNSEDETTSEII